MIRSEELSRDNARELVLSCFVDLCAETEAQGGFVPSTGEPDQERFEQREMAQERIGDLASQLSASKFDGSVRCRAEELLSTRALTLGQLPAARQADVLSGVARALVEQQRLFLLRMEDRLARAEPVDTLFKDRAPAVSAVCAVSTPLFENIAPVRGPTVGEAVQLYLASGEKKWVRKTFMARQWQLRYVEEHFGAGTTLVQINSHHVRAYRDGILALRANHGRTSSQSFLEKQTDNADRRIASKTAALIFEPAKAFFRWCAKTEGMIPKNPAEDVQIAAESKQKGQKSRRPFLRGELEKLFSAPLFKGCKSRHRRYLPGNKVIWDAKFWIPVLAHYSGARMGELVQLHLSDVRLDGEVPYFSINEENDPASPEHRKHVKSDAGVRLVPIHPDVLELGFGEFLANRRTGRKSSDRLFPEVSYGSDGQASTVFSKWFARFLDEAGLSDPALVFHSFRHNAQDAFRDAREPQYVIDRIIGHYDGAVSSAYGNGVSLAVAYEAVKGMRLLVNVPTILTLAKP